MPDKFSKETRSKIMSCIRSRDTKPELLLKKALRGYGFLYQPRMPESPDFVNKKDKVAIFVHGCFWHKCQKHFKSPKSNKRYWTSKIEKNVARDKLNVKMLEKKGYNVLVIWEHSLKPKNL